MEIGLLSSSSCVGSPYLQEANLDLEMYFSRTQSEFNPVTCRVEPKAIDSRSLEQKEYDAVRLATLLNKASKLPIRPMTLDANGKMTSFEEIQMKAKLEESDSDSEN